MDIASLIGILAGLVFTFLGIAGLDLATDSVGAFLHTPSVLLVGGGLLAALLISSPIRDILRIPGIVTVCLRSRSRSPVELINRLVQFAEIARRDGILALEGVTEDLDDEFLVRGIQLAVDGTDPELIEQIMNTELENLTDRHSSGKRIFDTLTKYAPAWGLIGTVIGLIMMLTKLKGADPGEIGEGMALALVTTFYGAMLANFVFGPMADKCVSKQEEEMLLRNIVVRGVLAIQSGDNPRIVEQKLRVFLPPRLRATEGGA
jgi:chemotaxis protein MotA